MWWNQIYYHSPLCYAYFRANKTLNDTSQTSLQRLVVVFRFLLFFFLQALLLLFEVNSSCLPLLTLITIDAHFLRILWPIAVNAVGCQYGPALRLIACHAHPLGVVLLRHVRAVDYGLGLRPHCVGLAPNDKLIIYLLKHFHLPVHSCYLGQSTWCLEVLFEVKFYVFYVLILILFLVIKGGICKHEVVELFHQSVLKTDLLLSYIIGLKGGRGLISYWYSHCQTFFHYNNANI